MKAQRWMAIAWIAFLAAAALEVLVFTAFDPLDMVWLGRSWQWSRMAIYTVSFFVLWAVALVAGYVTVMLAQTPQRVTTAAV